MKFLSSTDERVLREMINDWRSSRRRKQYAIMPPRTKKATATNGGTGGCSCDCCEPFCTGNWPKEGQYQDDFESYTSGQILDAEGYTANAQAQSYASGTKMGVKYRQTVLGGVNGELVAGVGRQNRFDYTQIKSISFELEIAEVNNAGPAIIYLVDPIDGLATMFVLGSQTTCTLAGLNAGLAVLHTLSDGDVFRIEVDILAFERGQSVTVAARYYINGTQVESAESEITGDTLNSIPWCNGAYGFMQENSRHIYDNWNYQEDALNEYFAGDGLDLTTATFSVRSDTTTGGDTAQVSVTSNGVGLDVSNLNGDHLPVDYTPSNYTPSTSPAEAADVDDLAAHLAGIDTAIGVASGGTTYSAGNGLNLTTTTFSVVADSTTGGDVAAVTVSSNGVGIDVSDLDGDHLDIDYTPSNYTPTTSPSEAADVDDLAAHLAGIDNAFGGFGTFEESAGNPTTTQFVSDNDWGMHINTSSGTPQISCNEAGTVYWLNLTTNGVPGSILKESTSDPTTSDFATGETGFHYNSISGTAFVVWNRNGTIHKSAMTD